MHVGKLNSVLIKLSFRTTLLKRAYTRADFERFIAQSGFRKFEIAAHPVGFEVSSFK